MAKLNEITNQVKCHHNEYCDKAQFSTRGSKESFVPNSWSQFLQRAKDKKVDKL